MTRLLDILFSGIAILILFPFLLPVVALLAATGEHDVFYRQIRVGRGNREFGLLKFATMLRDSPNLPGGLYTQKNDPRMLPLGAFLRKTKVNELPQLINIFLGQMSVVGYRPTVPSHFQAYPEGARAILKNSRPGLTGIGSVFFRNEEEILQGVSDKEFFHQKVIAPYKAELECWYCANAGIVNYFKLILVTIIVVVSPKSSGWKKLFKDLPKVPSELVQYLGVH